MDAVAGNAAFKDALIVLAAAGVVIPLFHRFRVSPVLGFMLVGIVVGPFGAGREVAAMPWLRFVTIADPDAIQPIAQLGVVLLMFMIGLELSFERLWRLRGLVFGLGALQLLVCTALLTGVALLADIPLRAAIVLALAAAMSSTAIVLQVLEESGQGGSRLGRASFAILLFQDIAVVPILFALSLAAPRAASSSLGAFAVIVGQAGAAVLALVAFGRLALRPLFRSVARTRSPELFMAACLLVVIASALATEAAGLSMALGALIGGLLLAGTEYGRQIEVTVDPFKGLLIGVFLISVGLGLDLGLVVAHPWPVLGAVAAMLTLKLAGTAPAARAFGLSWPTATQAALLLSPGGEFGFVILAIAVPEGFLSRGAAAQALVAIALTMVLTPLLARVGDRIAQRASPAPEIDPALDTHLAEAGHPRALIAGFGRVGETVAAMLDVHRISYVAIDSDADHVARQRRQGRPVFYGDVTRIELLRRLRLDTAQALVVTMNDHRAVEELVATARAERPDLLIVARARDAGHAAELYRAGASDAVPETIEASLQLSEAVLVDLGVAMGPVLVSIHEKRAEFQAGIKAKAPNAEIRTLGGRRLRDARPPPPQKT